ncbi:hypothetical protein A2U01_0078142, partial [Trifolium medium]|nr:hypothetical protein [Trifolium medium]
NGCCNAFIAELCGVLECLQLARSRGLMWNSIDWVKSRRKVGVSVTGGSIIQRIKHLLEID